MRASTNQPTRIAPPRQWALPVALLILAAMVPSYALGDDTQPAPQTPAPAAASENTPVVTPPADSSTEPKVVVHNAASASTLPAGTIRISMPGRVAVYHAGEPVTDDAAPVAASTTPAGGIVIPANTLGPGEPLWMAREREAREQDRADLVAEGIAGSGVRRSTYTVNAAHFAGVGWDNFGYTYFPQRYRRDTPRRPINTQPRPPHPINGGNITENAFGNAQREFYRATQPVKIITDPNTGLWIQQP